MNCPVCNRPMPYVLSQGKLVRICKHQAATGSAMIEQCHPPLSVGTKSELEQALEAERMADIEEAQSRLFGEDLNDEIVRINHRAAQWKIEHP